MKFFKANQKGHASRQAGFTLIELLVVIGILAVLLSVTLIAINPARQFSQANNTKRRSDVNAILNAVNQYMADTKGVVPAAITTTAQPIANTGADICALLVPTYIAALPSDPASNNGAAIAPCVAVYNVGYTIMKSATNGRITVEGGTVELQDPVSVTR